MLNSFKLHELISVLRIAELCPLPVEMVLWEALNYQNNTGIRDKTELSANHSDLNCDKFFAWWCQQSHNFCVHWTSVAIFIQRQEREDNRDLLAFAHSPFPASQNALGFHVRIRFMDSYFEFPTCLPWDIVNVSGALMNRATGFSIDQTEDVPSTDLDQLRFLLDY